MLQCNLGYTPDSACKRRFLDLARLLHGSLTRLPCLLQSSRTCAATAANGPQLPRRVCRWLCPRPRRLRKGRSAAATRERSECCVLGSSEWTNVVSFSRRLSDCRTLLCAGVQRKLRRRSCEHARQRGGASQPVRDSGCYCSAALTADSSGACGASPAPMQGSHRHSHCEGKRRSPTPGSISTVSSSPQPTLRAHAAAKRQTGVGRAHHAQPS